MTDDIVWVTGGASGIGAGTVDAFKARGARVGILDLKAPETDDPYATCDISEPADVAAAVVALEQLTGPPGNLIHCAGVTGRAPYDEFTDELWRHILGVNLSGSFYVSRAVFKGMRARGYGRIVLVSSDAATRPIAGQAAYGPSKAGVEALAKIIAIEGAAHGVTCNVISPGVVDTPMTRGRWTREEMEDLVKASAIANPLGEVLEPIDMAEAAVFLCSAAARYITGQVLHVNGGALML